VKNITGNWFISAKGYVMDVAYSTQWTRGDTWRRPKWSQSRPLDQMDVSKSVQITLKGRLNPGPVSIGKKSVKKFGKTNFNKNVHSHFRKINHFLLAFYWYVKSK